MTIKGQRLGVGPWDVLHIGLYPELRAHDRDMGHHYRLYDYCRDCNRAEALAEARYLAEYGPDRSLYRFVQLVAA